VFLRAVLREKPSKPSFVVVLSLFELCCLVVDDSGTPVDEIFVDDSVFGPDISFRECFCRHSLQPVV